MTEIDLHDSDCATHNEPAYPNGPCDCSLSIPRAEAPAALGLVERLRESLAKIEAANERSRSIGPADFFAIRTALTEARQAALSIERMSRALEKIAADGEPYRSGYCQTDFSVDPALTAQEAQDIARAALSAQGGEG